MASPKKQQQFLVLGTPQAIQNFVDTNDVEVVKLPSDQDFANASAWSVVDFIDWDKKDPESMMFAQTELNKHIITNNFVIPDEFKSTITKLQHDLEEYSISTCNVCGNVRFADTEFDQSEHMKISVSWGYESMYDGEKHKLVLCDKCYDTHIKQGPLGKYMKIINYL